MKNVLYFHTHDTGRFLSPYGHALDTPNLDALARGGLLFRQAFDCCPTCSPARASLLTGQYPHQCGMTGLTHRGFKLIDPSQHLASFLRQAGFETVLAGVQHEVAGEANAIGYERSLQFSGDFHGEQDIARQRMQVDAHNTAAACDFLRERHQRPFFLSVGLVSTHRCFPETPDPQDDPRYMLPPSPVPNVPECRLDWARFATMVRLVDRCFGQVMAALRENGLLESTLVIVTSDHGPAFPGMKCCLTDNGCGIPLILHLPGTEAGFVSDALVSQLDVYPTVCEWLGLDSPPWLEGKSLFPLIRRETPTLHAAVFAELNFHASKEIARTVRTPRFRYVRRFDAYPKVILANIDNGDTKSFQLREAALAERRRGADEELFDLYYDPSECHSVACDDAYAATLADMRGRLRQWMRETADPLCTLGEMPPPNGVLLDPQDALVPTP